MWNQLRKYEFVTGFIILLIIVLRIVTSTFNYNQVDIFWKLNA